MDKKILDIEKELKKFETDKATEIELLSEELTLARYQLSEVNEKISVALDNGDVETYQELQEKLSNVETTIKVKLSRINVLKSRCAISKEEFTKYKKMLFDTIEELTKAKKEKARTLIKELIAICDDSDEEIQKVNSLLRMLQINIYPECITIYIKGEKRINNWAAKTFTSDIASMKPFLSARWEILGK